jgi:hypothetical protein
MIFSTFGPARDKPLFFKADLHSFISFVVFSKPAETQFLFCYPRAGGGLAFAVEAAFKKCRIPACAGMTKKNERMQTHLSRC